MDAPDLRLTIRRARVHAADWTPWLAGQGLPVQLLRARARAGVAFADVRRDDDELVVRFVAGDSPQAREHLLAWAARVGCRRVWLPGAVHDLAPACGGEVGTRCPTCGLRLVDDAPGLWDFVRAHGHFPAQCPLCGGALPQWEPCQTLAPAGDPAACRSTHTPTSTSSRSSRPTS